MSDERSLDEFERLLNYTKWANTRILEALRSGDDVPERAVELFSHLLRSRDVWYGRVEGTEHASLRFWVQDTLSECAERLDASTRRWRTVLADRGADGLDDTVEYENSSGEHFENTLRDVLTHVVNHGTHHRAQIALILREADIAPPATDYIYYLRNS